MAVNRKTENAPPQEKSPTMQRHFFVIILALAMLTCGCGQEESTVEPQQLEQEIQQLNEHRQREMSNQ